MWKYRTWSLFFLVFILSTFVFCLPSPYWLLLMGNELTTVKNVRRAVTVTGIGRLNTNTFSFISVQNQIFPWIFKVPNRLPWSLDMELKNCFPCSLKILGLDAKISCSYILFPCVWFSVSVCFYLMQDYMYMYFMLVSWLHLCKPSLTF